VISFGHINNVTFFIAFVFITVRHENPFDSGKASMLSEQIATQSLPENAGGADAKYLIDEWPTISKKQWKTHLGGVCNYINIWIASVLRALSDWFNYFCTTHFGSDKKMQLPVLFKNIMVRR
jgi:hypothetical protein